MVKSVKVVVCGSLSHGCRAVLFIFLAVAFAIAKDQIFTRSSIKRRRIYAAEGNFRRNLFLGSGKGIRTNGHFPRVASCGPDAMGDAKGQ